MKKLRLRLMFVLLLSTLACGRNGPAAGREVDQFRRSLPAEGSVRRIASLSYVEAETLCAIGAADAVVAMAAAPTRHTLIDDLCPELRQRPVVARGGEMNLERLVALQPDIVLCGGNEVACRRIEEAGLRPVALYPQRWTAVLDQAQIFGRFTGRSGSARQLSDHLGGLIERVGVRTRRLQPTARPTTYYVRTDFLTTLSGAPFSDMLATAGGRNVADTLSASPGASVTMSLERLMALDPDVIILRDRASLRVADVVADQRLSTLSAVRRGRVYQETDGWTEFRIESVFGLFEKARWLHPTLFEDLDPVKAHDQFVAFARALHDR